MLFGKRLAERRLAMSLSQKALGAKCNLDQKQISQYENGKGMPSLTHVAALCKALQCSSDWLLGQTPELGRIVGDDDALRAIMSAYRERRWEDCLIAIVAEMKRRNEGMTGA